jgi:hypothetical protein
MLKGSFAGLKISIDYRKLIEMPKEAIVDFSISNSEVTPLIGRTAQFSVVANGDRS